MEDEQAINEYELAQWTELENARLLSEQAKQTEQPAKASLSFTKKLGQHWIILISAGFFDILGLIPFLCVVTNMIFGFILFVYFKTRPNPPSESSFFIRQSLAILGGSLADMLLPFLPVNITATVVSITQLKK